MAGTFGHTPTEPSGALCAGGVSRGTVADEMTARDSRGRGKRREEGEAAKRKGGQEKES